MKRENVIHVALAFCDKSGNYARHAAAAIASVFANTESPVLVHLLHDKTLTGENLAALRGLAAVFGREIRFYDVTGREGECALGEKRRLFDGAMGMYYRLLIPSLLEVDKVIYIDCDVIVNLDLAELWDLPLNGRAVAAVAEGNQSLKPENFKDWVCRKVIYGAMGLDLRNYSYFNSGVLVMDLRKIRGAYDFPRQVRDFYAKFRYVTQFADQDCLNYIFLKDCRYIDDKFNRLASGRMDVINMGGNIWHFICGDKPWSSYTRPKIDELYWKYFAMTPFCSGQDELIGIILSAMSRSEYYHQRAGGCSRRLVKKLFHNLFKGHLLSYPRVFWYAGKAFLWNRAVAPPEKTAVSAREAELP